MSYMFYSASVFNQLFCWSINDGVDTTGMFDNSDARFCEDINVPAMGGIGLLALGLSMLGLGAVRMRRK
jgi:hypothetical protein